MYDSVWHFLTILDLFKDLFFIFFYFNHFCAVFDHVKKKLQFFIIFFLPFIYNYWQFFDHVDHFLATFDHFLTTNHDPGNTGVNTGILSIYPGIPVCTLNSFWLVGTPPPLPKTHI